MSGPRPTPTPAVAAQIEIARARSGPLNTSMMTESVEGMIMAPPMPMTARAAITCPDDSEKMTTNAAMAKMTRPIRSIFALPKRSPRPPMVSKSPAKTSR